MTKRGDKFIAEFPNTKATCRSSRKRIKKQLRASFGDTCHWCGKTMEFPVYKTHSPITERTATIEHHFAKEKGDNIMYLRLVCHGCNK